MNRRHFVNSIAGLCEVATTAGRANGMQSASLADRQKAPNSGVPATKGRAGEMRHLLFPGNEQFWYETLRTFDHIAYGGADFGEVLTLSDRIVAGDYDSWYNEYLTVADRLTAEAEIELRAGHGISARDGLLRASNYYRSAEFFLHVNPKDPRINHAYDLSVSTFRQAAKFFPYQVQVVAIPYEGTTLPGYFYRAGDSNSPRPTILIHTGFDGTAEEMHFQGSPAMVERGYNVLAFDGPGQGAPLRHQGLVFRPDWEKVITPVVDFTLTLPGVDSKRVGLWGTSMGGMLAPRAAAFEHRLAALIAYDGVYDLGDPIRAAFGNGPDLNRRLRAQSDPELDAKLAVIMQNSALLKWGMENAQYAYGKSTPREAAAAWLDYSLRGGVAKKITCPTLVCDGATDSMLPGQAKLLFNDLTCKKTYLEFTDAEGAGAHCHVGAQRLANARVCNWLDDTFGNPLG